MCKCEESLKDKYKIQYTKNGVEPKIYINGLCFTNISIRQWINNRYSKYSKHEQIIFEYCPICGEPYC